MYSTTDVKEVKDFERHVRVILDDQFDDDLTITPITLEGVESGSVILQFSSSLYLFDAIYRAWKDGKLRFKGNNILCFLVLCSESFGFVLCWAFRSKNYCR